MSETIKQPYGYITFHQVLDFADIHHVEVEADLRGRGLGTQLMALFIEEMVLREVSEITLEVRIDNHAAIKLYEKIGFKEVNKRKGYYNGVDGILMHKSLTGGGE